MTEPTLGEVGARHFEMNGEVKMGKKLWLMSTALSSFLGYVRLYTWWFVNLWIRNSVRNPSAGSNTLPLQDRLSCRLVTRI